MATASMLILQKPRAPCTTRMAMMPGRPNQGKPPFHPSLHDLDADGLGTACAYEMRLGEDALLVGDREVHAPHVLDGGQIGFVLEDVFDVPGYLPRKPGRGL